MQGLLFSSESREDSNDVRAAARRGQVEGAGRFPLSYFSNCNGELVLEIDRVDASWPAEFDAVGV
jgi:hypothetical protein